MTLFEQYSLLEFILNKDYSGNVLTPDRFQKVIRVVNISLFCKKIGLPQEYQLGRPIPREYIEINKVNSVELSRFKKKSANTPSPNGLLPYPSDYALWDQVVNNVTKIIDGVSTVIPRPVEILRAMQCVSRRGNWTKKPTTYYPIGEVTADGIQLYPITITSVDFHYWRYPADPLFAYTQNEGYISANDVACTEFEWPLELHPELIQMELEYFGINMREADIVQYAEQKLQQGV
jgi:hypothetical protein